MFGGVVGFLGVWDLGTLRGGVLIGVTGSTPQSKHNATPRHGICKVHAPEPRSLDIYTLRYFVCGAFS